MSANRWLQWPVASDLPERAAMIKITKRMRMRVHIIREVLWKNVMRRIPKPPTAFTGDGLDVFNISHGLICRGFNFPPVVCTTHICRQVIFLVQAWICSSKRHIHLCNTVNNLFFGYQCVVIYRPV